jgi:hypothetical protein
LRRLAAMKLAGGAKLFLPKHAFDKPRGVRSLALD